VPAVLVTDGELRSSLAAVRSLGRAGHAPHVCSVRGASLAGASRFASGEAQVPDPLTQPERFIAAVEDLTRRQAVKVLLPMSDASLLAILSVRDRFTGVHIPFPQREVFCRVSDKLELLTTAAALGIPVPSQHVLRQRADRVRLGRRSLRFPLVVKPTRSVTLSPQGAATFGVRYAHQETELTAILDALPAQAYPVLLQQPILGPGLGVFLLRWSDQILAIFSHRRLREKPPSGGVSVYCESTPLDRRLVSQSIALLEQFGWQGVAMVEYKQQEATGDAYLMEVNGRFWGSLQLAIDAGVDFPSLLVRAALGERVSPVRSYEVGVRSRWLWGDVDHLLARLRGARPGLDLESAAPSTLAVLWEFLHFWRTRERMDVWDPLDRRPFIRETLNRLSALGA